MLLNLYTGISKVLCENTNQDPSTHYFKREKLQFIKHHLEFPSKFLVLNQNPVKTYTNGSIL